MEQPQASQVDIRQEERDGAGAFFVESGGERLAELRYTRSTPETAVIEHTEVSKLLGGRGVGRQLVEAAVSWARASGTKLVPHCTYARSVLERNPGMRDVLK